MKQNIFIHDIYTLYIYSLLIFKYFFNINLFILKLIKTSTLVKKKNYINATQCISHLLLKCGQQN